MVDKTMRNRFTGGAGYAPLNEQTIGTFLESSPQISNALGGRSRDWSIREVGDGNLNLVFIVKGPTGGVCLKQALPYVRLVGESWPLPIDRAHFEHEALKAEGAVVPDLVPKIYLFDKVRAAIVMELLEPHIILRKGLIQGIRYPRLADDISTFAAQTLFSTSDLALPAGRKRDQQSMFSLNTELCRITEELVFTDPYRIAELNRWTTPQLDGVAAEFRGDARLKVAVQQLKWMFLSRGEALLHGDLHTGSIMVTPEQTRVIDPEFAFYGPMGFDLGAFMANLLLCYYSQDGHATAGDDRSDYRRWLLDTLETFWRSFEIKFLELWRKGGTGDAFVSGLFEDQAGREAIDAYRAGFMARLLQDSIGFAGAKMVRRILGLAHVEDMESIKDPDCRARCERRALNLARQLILSRRSISSMTAVRRLAESVWQG
jgi:5-methylthioribose kinase